MDLDQYYALLNHEAAIKRAEYCMVHQREKAPSFLNLASREAAGLPPKYQESVSELWDQFNEDTDNIYAHMREKQ